MLCVPRVLATTPIRDYYVSEVYFSLFRLFSFASNLVFFFFFLLCVLANLTDNLSVRPPFPQPPHTNKKWFKLQQTAKCGINRRPKWTIQFQGLCQEFYEMLNFSFFIFWYLRVFSWCFCVCVLGFKHKEHGKDIAVEPFPWYSNWHTVNEICIFLRTLNYLKSVRSLNLLKEKNEEKTFYPIPHPHVPLNDIHNKPIPK